MILLLRHGKTEANEQRLYAGALDWPLSAAGRRELLAYRAKGLYPKAQAFYTSGMLRCEQTFELLYGEQPHQRVEQLSEYRFGAFEGRSHAQLEADPAYQAWINDPAGTVACPGGESREAFRSRVEAGFERLVPWRSAPSLAVAVLHGGVIAVLMEMLFPAQNHFYAWQPAVGQGWLISASRYRALTPDAEKTDEMTERMKDE